MVLKNTVNMLLIPFNDLTAVEINSIVRFIGEVL